MNTFLPNTTILSALVNGNNTDFASGLSNAMCKDGQQVSAANQPMGNFKLTGLGAGSARTDSISLGQSQDGGVNWVVSGGAADAITATYAPALTALIDGQLCYFRATAANATTTPTFAPNGLTARTITKVGGTALVAGDIPGNLSECALRYNLANTRWELVNPAVPTASIGAGQLAASAVGWDPINLQLNMAVGSNLLAVAIKAASTGNDPTASNPVLIPFRDSTVTNGDPVVISVAAATVITTFVGATLGTANNTAFRFWIVAFNNAGTVVLALWNSTTLSGGLPVSIAALDEATPQSSTSISAGSTSAGVFYTVSGTAVTSKAFRILGYLEYSAGLVTAGTYNIAPTKIQLFGPGIHKPGATVQLFTASSTTSVSVTLTTFISVTGLAGTLNMTSAANPVEAQAFGNASISSAVASMLMAQIFRNTGSVGFGCTALFNGNGGTNAAGSPIVCYGLDFPNSLTPQYGLELRSSSGPGGFSFLSTSLSVPATNGILVVKEIMA